MIGKTNAVASGGETNPVVVMSRDTSPGLNLRLKNLTVGDYKAVNTYYSDNSAKIGECGYRVTDNGIVCYFIENSEASYSSGPSVKWNVETVTSSSSGASFSDADIDITMPYSGQYSSLRYLGGFMTPGKYRGQLTGWYVLNEIWVDFEIKTTSGSVGNVKLIGVVSDVDSLKAQLRTGLLIDSIYVGYGYAILNIPLNTIEKIA